MNTFDTEDQVTDVECKLRCHVTGQNIFYVNGAYSALSIQIMYWTFAVVAHSSQCSIFLLLLLLFFFFFPSFLQFSLQAYIYKTGTCGVTIVDMHL